MLNPALYLVVFYIVFQLILRQRDPELHDLPAVGPARLEPLLGRARGRDRIGRRPTPGSSRRSSFPREILPLASVGAGAGALLPAGDRAARWRSSCSGTSSRGRTCRCSSRRCSRCCCSPPRIGMFLAAINVYLRDTQHLLELALLAWFWMTPIVYPYCSSPTSSASTRRGSTCSIRSVDRAHVPARDLRAGRCRSRRSNGTTVDHAILPRRRRLVVLLWHLARRHRGGSRGAVPRSRSRSSAGSKATSPRSSDRWPTRSPSATSRSGSGSSTRRTRRSRSG